MNQKWHQSLVSFWLSAVYVVGSIDLFNFFAVIHPCHLNLDGLDQMSICMDWTTIVIYAVSSCG